ncbi:hypothetical protein P5673_001111 [Acropora cervicornis]|uniref:Uncharacterized protein n=1 Tax=Acropora cervicornis TaxID=6130 RepID=A0AAD9R5C7_ACRCE|nr:hypothetical protein P5673_001111 [Acropora cervicornis]
MAASAARQCTVCEAILQSTSEFLNHDCAGTSRYGILSVQDGSLLLTRRTLHDCYTNFASIVFPASRWKLLNDAG